MSTDYSLQEIEINPDWDTENTVGFGIFRGVPVQKGHIDVGINMCMNHRQNVVGIGSINSTDIKRTPLNSVIRRQMWSNVLGDRVSFVELPDLGFVNYAEAWYEFVLTQIQAQGLPIPTDYYSGSAIDAKWYMNYFAGYDPIVIKNETYTVYHNRHLNRRLHILDRSKRIVISATDIRTSIELRDDTWKQWVPKVNHKLVEENYPPQLRVPLQVQELPKIGSVPDGTFCILNGEEKYQKVGANWIQLDFVRGVF